MENTLNIYLLLFLFFLSGKKQKKKRKNFKKYMKNKYVDIYKIDMLEYFIRRAMWMSVNDVGTWFCGNFKY